MADNEKQILSLDLDAKGFISSAMEAKKVLGELGDVENISGMLGGFAKMGIALGVVGASLYAMKEAFDLTLEAEKIDKINSQFDTLSKNAGIAGNELKEALEKGAHGLIDDTDLLEIANKGMIELGKNSMVMGQTLELAMKISKVSGQEATQVFENLNLAIASGNTRMLRQYGIIVDNEKALKAYAKTHGMYVSDLSEEQKKLAISESALKKAQDAYKGVTAESNTLTSASKKLGVQWNEVKEAFAIAVEKFFRPVFLPVVNAMTSAVHSFGNGLKQVFGSEAQKASVGIENLTDKIKDISESIESAKKHEGFFNKLLSEETLQKKIATMEGFKNQYLARLEELKAKSAELSASEGGGGAEADKAEADQRISTRIKFEQDLVKLKQARLMEEMDLETDYDAIQSQRSEQIVLMHEEMEARIKAIDENARKEGVEGTEIVEAQKAEIRAKYALDVQKIGQDLVNDQIRVANQSAKANARTVDGFSKGWKSASLNASKDLGNFAKLGEISFNALNKNGKNAFIALGEGSKTASEAMKSFMLNSIADIAEAQGEMLLASGIGSFNPIQIAEGGALLALSGLLRSVAGGGKGGIGASSGGGGGGGGPSAPDLGTPSTFESLQTTEAQRPQKAVTIQVQGNYFETEQTKRTLMEMIRQETDATAFSYVQINQGGAS